MGLENVFKLSLIVNLIDRITAPSAKIKNSMDESMKGMDGWNQKLKDMTKNGAALAGVGAAITNYALKPVQAAYATSQALGEVSSLGIKDLSALKKASREFSDQFAGTTKAEFISAAYDIKSGVSSLTDEGVAQYTTLAALTGKATKATTAEMTSLFATGYNIYKSYYSDMTDMEFGEMFSAGIAKSVQTFKTDGSKLAESISTLGASATTANVPLEEQLSILGMLQATMGGSEAGTKYKSFLASAAKAGDELGLSFLDANNQLLGLPDILDQLHSKFGDTIDAAEKMELTKAFGTEEAVAMIDLLYGKTGELQNNIVSLYDSMGGGTELTKQMADAINNTDPGKYQVFQQHIQNIKEDLGNALMPTANQLLDLADQAVGKVGGWVSEHQKLAGVIMGCLVVAGMLTAGVGTAMMAVGAFGMAATSASKGFGLLKTGVLGAGKEIKKLGPLALKAGTSLKGMGTAGLTAVRSLGAGILTMGRTAITTATTALPGLIAGVWSFTAALLANPVTWIVIAIMALIGVVILLWKNWDKVTAAIGAFAGKVGGAVTAGMNWVKSGISEAVAFITEKIAWFRTAGERIMTTLTAGIKSMAMAPVNALKGAFTKLRKLLPFSDAKEGPLSQLTLNGRRVMETISTGIVQTSDQPGQAARKAFHGINETGPREIKKVDLGAATEKREMTEWQSASGKTGEIRINKLILQVDLNKLDDLKKLKDLLNEIRDDANNGTEIDPDDPDIELMFA